MATTSQLLLPIPDLTQAADGPDAFQKGLQGVEDFFYSRTISTAQTAAGVTRTPRYHWGSLTSLPTPPAADVRTGDTAWYSTYSVLVMWNGSNWQQCRIPTVSPGNGDGIPGFYDGQYRDHSVVGLQRWSTARSTWETVNNSATGRVPINTTKVPNNTALTGVINVPAAYVPYRVVFTIAGAAGFDTSAQGVGATWDSTPANATLVDKDVNSQAYCVAGQWASFFNSMTVEMPSGVPCTARAILQAGTSAYVHASVVWRRSAIV